MSGLAIAEYGGKVLVQNPSPEVREGKKSSVAIVIEFESIENAHKFYESENYTAARAVRELVADTDLILLKDYKGCYELILSSSRYSASIFTFQGSN